MELWAPTVPCGQHAGHAGRGGRLAACCGGRRAGSAAAAREHSWARGVWPTRRAQRPAPPASVPCSRSVCLGCDVVQCSSRRASRPHLCIANGIATATRLLAHNPSRTNTPDPNRWRTCRRACSTHAVCTQRRPSLSARINTAPLNRTLGTGRRHPPQLVAWYVVAIAECPVRVGARAKQDLVGGSMPTFV